MLGDQVKEKTQLFFYSFAYPRRNFYVKESFDIWHQLRNFWVGGKKGLTSGRPVTDFLKSFRRLLEAPGVHTRPPALPFQGRYLA